MADGDRLHAGLQNFKWLVVDPVELKAGHRTSVSLYSILKGITKRLLQATLDLGVAIQRDRPSQIKLHQSQVVQAEDMIGMFMGVTHRVYQAQTLADQLLPQVGWRVDQQVAVGQAKHGATSRALVFGITAGADRTMAAQRRHPDTGSRPQ
jgi:hypothetical protein